MRKFLLALVITPLASAVLAQDQVTIPATATSMFTTAQTFIQGLEAPLGTMLVAAFGVVLIFVAYKLAKRGINKV